MVSCLVAIAAISCTDHITDGLEANKPEPDKQHVKFDEEALYRLQTDKGYILTNQIRYKSGRFVLDLNRKDAEELGIENNLYENAIKQVNLINNTNLKLKSK